MLHSFVQMALTIPLVFHTDKVLRYCLRYQLLITGFELVTCSITRGWFHDPANHGILHLMHPVKCIILWDISTNSAVSRAKKSGPRDNFTILIAKQSVMSQYISLWWYGQLMLRRMSVLCEIESRGHGFESHPSTFGLEQASLIVARVKSKWYSLSLMWILHL